MPLTIFSYMSIEHTVDAVVVKRMAAFLNAGVRLGALRPAAGRAFALDDLAEAHRYLEKGLHAEKVNLAVGDTASRCRSLAWNWAPGSAPGPGNAGNSSAAWY